MKGDYLGECNRSACRSLPATYFNTSTHRYYCTSCAKKINSWCLEEPICILSSAGSPEITEELAEKISENFSGFLEDIREESFHEASHSNTTNYLNKVLEDWK